MTTPKETTREALPDLPEAYDGMPHHEGLGILDAYTAEQMRAYAQSALESERQAHAAEVERLRGDAERYRLLRRGQHWSVIDGMGYTLRAEQIDAAIDQAIARGKPQPQRSDQ